MSCSGGCIVFKPPLHNRTYVCSIPQGMRSAFYTDVGIVCCNGAFCRGSVPHGFPVGSPWVPAPRYDNWLFILFYFLRQNWTNDCSWFLQNCESKAAWRHEPLLAKRRLYTWNCSSQVYCGRPAFLCLCKIMWRARGNQRSETKLEI